ncbi:MAG: PstS family phosphate ABC transporter substrate-binding protein [Candidatus Omnitrophica bacterium]|nr:PstS family phosphate ABC transporter substrate-binding protein [Candidatus Omnitrophota bacterium]
MNRLRVITIAVLLMFLCIGLCMAEDKMIQIKGSDTLINVVQKLAEIYMAQKPGANISVTGGGSGTGVAALVNNKCDIANSSRSIKSSEVEQANNKGIDPKRVVVAIDGLSIIVNAANPIDKLTVDQIGKIYRGEVKNWNELGGADSPVSLYGRQSNSGTYDFMKEVVMKGEYSSSLKSMNGNAQIVEAIKQDASGIGYVGVGYVKDATGIKVLNVAVTPGMGYFSPLNEMDVKNGHYPITRPLNQYMNGVPKGMARDFIIFELSKEGQDIVEKEGFFAVPAEYQRYNNDTLGIKGEVGESPVAKYSAQGRDGN